MNWNSFTYRQKNKFIGIAYVLFACIVYKMAVSKTVDLYLQNNQIDQKVIEFNESLENREEIAAKKKKIENHIAAFFVDSISHQDILIETISNYCHHHHILLKELPAMTKYQEGEFEVGTYKIVLEGEYIPLLKLAHLLEKNNTTGRVSSVLFQLKYDHKRKKDILTMSMYVQNIQRQIHDESAI